MNITIKAPKNPALFPYLKELGYAGLDYSFPSFQDRECLASGAFERELSERMEAMRACGLSAVQCHLTYYPSHLPPLGDGSYDAYERELLPILEYELSLAARYGIGIAVIHLFIGADQASSREGNLILLEKLLPTLRETGITLAIENIYHKGCTEGFLSSAEDILYYIRHFNDRHIAACFDSGHAIARGQDPLEMLRGLGDKTAALHIHSNVPGRDLHQLPGTILKTLKWSALGATLREIGYAGSFNMEIVPYEMTEKAERAYYALAYAIAEGLLSK